ncbi:MAG: glycosyltransferase family 9 protein [Nitrospinae bacterium]|nr:glycosyltransferase family 9 protein [Nitrospinota bacterium]
MSAFDRPRKILVVKLGAMGDLVMASAFFDALRRRFPEAEIVLLAGKTYGRVLERHPVFDRLVLADDAAIYRGGLGARLREVLRIVPRLRRESFDWVFVLHRAWPFNLLAFLSGARRRVGFARGREGILLTDRVVPARGRNEREIYLDLLRAAGVPAVYEKSFYYLSEEEDRFLEEFVRRHGIREGECVVGVGPGGGKNAKLFMPTKRWPADNYVLLIKKLPPSCRIVLFGSRDERDLADRILSDCPDCVDATDLSYGEMASVFRRCRLYIGNDSGPLHIAEAMGIATLSFFGPTNPSVQAPLGPRHSVLYKRVECSPCYDDGRFPECDHMTCLNSITAEEAAEAARALLSGTA